MWRCIRFIAVTVLVAVALLVGGIGVVVLAQDDNGTATSLWDR